MDEILKSFSVTMILTDEKEKRVVKEDQVSVRPFCAALTLEPRTITEFNRYYRKFKGGYLFTEVVKPNYNAYNPGEKTKYDIPKITKEMRGDCKEHNRNNDVQFTIKQWREEECYRGIIEADLTTKTMRYVSKYFEIRRAKKPRILEKHDISVYGKPYHIPLEWKLTGNPK